MNPHRSCQSAGLMLGLLISLVANAGRLPPWPELLQSQAMGDSLRLNGHATQLFALRSAESPQDVVTALQTQWEGRLRTRNSGRWQVLSHLQGRRLFTVQLQPTAAGGTRGLASLATLADTPVTEPAALPRLPGTHLHQWLDAEDGGRRSRTVVFVGTASAQRQLTFYRDHFRALGFQPVGSGALRLGPDGGSLVLQGATAQASVAVRQRGDITLVAILTVDNPR
ncbi:hypothetical protein JN531_002350 [Flagellatimonas centrodinii]|uniref:hypothetical protein n=1 Tax=Flagellatimonas centrodinii TaxID=2806210 RepID=UPI001FFD35E1|nr:hypothetical protein [Flagellatimonas centrodinii]ULQ47135.1 hypothetical protein JN531_002350 [Flagellatimonas centrodinii]